MKLQYSCCCGSKFIGIDDAEHLAHEDERVASRKFLEIQYEKFHRRHAPCTKIMLGIHDSQKGLQRTGVVIPVRDDND